MKTSLIALSLMTVSPWLLASGEQVSTVETPSVPASLLKEQEGTKLETITVQPGNNAIIPIAMGHLNRLVLPFQEPQIRTVNPATTQLEGHVLYVAPSDENPVTLYVTPNGSEEFALSITLAPKKIPPREIHLTLSPESQKKLHAHHAAPVFVGHGNGPVPSQEPKGQDYVSELKYLFRSVALGTSPQGYNLRSPEAGESTSCKQKGLRFKTGQVLEGRDLLLVVGVAQNPGRDPIVFEEGNCASNTQVAAVAAWPNVRIEPGRSAEIYVVLRRRGDVSLTQRPSLIGAQP
jgi:conjugal transfer pilus assembly protein TraK